MLKSDLFLRGNGPESTLYKFQELNYKVLALHAYKGRLTKDQYPPD